jgi:uncharacterized membrane protein (UPF0182 family)
VVAARRSPRRWILLLLGAVLVVLVTAGSVARFYTDLLWFREVGQTGVFWGRITAQVALGLVAGVGTALVIFLNLFIVDRLAPRYRLIGIQRSGPAEQYRAMIGPYLRSLRIAIAAFLGLVVGLQTSGLWQSFLLWRNQTSFGQRDPQFGRDIGFYVFELPFQRAMFGWLFSTLVLTTLLVLVAHYLLGGIRPGSETGRVAPPVLIHVSILLGLVVMLKAWAYRLDQFDLLYSTRGVTTGASYTDVNAQLKALQFLVLVAIGCALLFFYNVRQRGYVLPVAGLVVLSLVSILSGGIYPAVVQRFQVAPQQLQREAPFIQRNIDATRSAFGLDAIELSDFPAATNLGRDQLRKNSTTLDNVRVWEPNVLKQATSNLQAIGQYYDFSDVDVDRYKIGDELRQVMISAREVDPTKLQATAQTWQNVHLAYTHGYGVVAAQVNTADSPAGRPVYVVKNFENLDKAQIPINQPRIYFGELLPDAPAFTVGNTKQPEVDAPSPGSQQGAATFNYNGKGGIQLTNPLRRLAFALRFRDINLLISGNITGRSRLMFDRDIRDRIDKVAPFLQWDGDPYVAVVDGRIVFIRDGYTTTANYPYSERVNLEDAARPESRGAGVEGQANYIRNSVKAVVDAFDGTVNLYTYDEQDPVLRTWRKAFPNLIKQKADIPEKIKEHLRYPEDLFSIQADRYKSYHIAGANDFYSKQDFWDLPEDRSGEVRQQQNAPTLVPGGETTERARPYYLLTELPGETSDQFLVVQTFTPNNKANLVSYLAARADPAGESKIVSYSLPRNQQISGPAQVSAQILADPSIAQEVTFFNQQGSRVTFGNLLVVPIEKSLMYVQPLFVQQAGGNAIPELRRVAVLLNDRLGYEPTLGAAIDEAMKAYESGTTGGTTSGGVTTPPTTSPGSPPSGTPPSGTTDVKQLLDQASQALADAQAALQKGDLAGYQANVDKARTLIQQAQAAAGRPS